MTDWLSFCRGAVADLDEVLRGLPTRAEREPVLRLGEGGDDTTAIDAAAEDAVVRRLEALDVDLTLVSEELGVRSFGNGGGPTVVVDPIDGSVNAKRGIPFFSLSVAVADGPTMDDVFFGYVYDFGAREEWVAERGSGAFLDGTALDGPGPKDTIEILSLEGTTTEAIATAAPAVRGVARRLRVMGSLALSLCHLAAGRVDARLLPQACTVDRHRCRPASRARAGLRDRAVRGSAVRPRTARSRAALAGRRSGDERPLRATRGRPALTGEAGRRTAVTRAATGAG